MMAMAHSTFSSDQAFGSTPSASIHDSLLAICEAISSKLDLKEVLDQILGLTMREMQAQEGSILLFDEHQDRLNMLASIGLNPAIVAKGYIPRKGSIAEWVIENNQPLILNDQPTARDYRPLDARRRIVSSMCVPLRVRGRVLGTINLNRTNAMLGVFDSGALDTMVILASQAAIFIDNTRLHESNMKSERLAAIGQTVAGISHCIKNVLTGVRGGMSLMEMASGNEDWKLARQGQDILRRNLERLSSIVLDMLDYSKERQPDKIDINLFDLADEVFNTAGSEARAKEITLERRISEGAQCVQADSAQLFRCVLNLVQNAIDATPKGGTVWIGSERRDATPALNRLKDKSAKAAIIMRVGDTGPGIDEEHQNVLFEPFFSTKGSKGTGLGLAVTRKIIEEHGGHIELESPPGTPAVFAVYLPE